MRGGDAAHKLAILVGLCFGTQVDVHAIPTDGIDIVEPIDLAYAEKFGYVIKPLVYAKDHGNAVEARVHPALIPANWLLADVGGPKNAVYVHSYALGPSLYYGAGAGMLPTAMAVVSDMIEIGRNIFARAAGAPAPGTQAAGLYPWYAVPGRAERDLKVVCGHWSTLGLFIGHGVHAIDTGAVWGGKLTALQLDTDELRVVQVPGRDVPVNPPQARQRPSQHRPPQRRQSTDK